MSLTDDSHICFHYNGFGREIRIHLEGNEAEYLPKILTTFADFLRASGFVYVGVKEMADGYLFHKHYSKDDDDSWAETYNSEFFGLADDDDEEQEEINHAASEYWDTLIDKAGHAVKVGDTVYYHGRGEPETTLNEKEEPQGHGGRTGVTLLNMRGSVVKIEDTPVGVRALVQWDNWHDGHNGMGGDPNARMSDRNYWWSNINNLVVSH